MEKKKKTPNFAVYDFICVQQIMLFTWCRFLVSYIPGGTTGLTFMAKLFSRLCSRTISSAIDA